MSSKKGKAKGASRGNTPLAIPQPLQPCIVVVEDVWAQCDTCQKWRRLPAGAAAPPDDAPWWVASACAGAAARERWVHNHRALPLPRYCKMNPDRSKNNCKAPEEVEKGLAGRRAAEQITAYTI